MKRLKMKRVCEVQLSDMTPVSGGHHCHQCDKVVHDLRGATYAEARAVFRRSESTPCVRILPDPGGFAVLRRSRNAMAFGVALFATTGAAACDEVREGLDHAAHLGDPHTDHHTDEYGLAGEPVPEWLDETETPQGPETDPETDPAMGN